MRFQRKFYAYALLAAAAVPAADALATGYIWKGAGITGLWGDPFNWVPVAGGPPAGADTANFTVQTAARTGPLIPDFTAVTQLNISGHALTGDYVFLGTACFQNSPSTTESSSTTRSARQMFPSAR